MREGFIFGEEKKLAHGVKPETFEANIKAGSKSSFPDNERAQGLCNRAGLAGYKEFPQYRKLSPEEARELDQYWQDKKKEGGE